MLTNPQHAKDQFRVLMVLPRMITIMISEMLDWSISNILARTVRGDVSVGLNATDVVNAMKR